MYAYTITIQNSKALFTKSTKFVWSVWRRFFAFLCSSERTICVRHERREFVLTGNWQWTRKLLLAPSDWLIFSEYNWLKILGGQRKNNRASAGSPFPPLFPSLYPSPPKRAWLPRLLCTRLERLHKLLMKWPFTSWSSWGMKICGKELNRNEFTSRLEGVNGVG